MAEDFALPTIAKMTDKDGDANMNTSFSAPATGDASTTGSASTRAGVAPADPAEAKTAPAAPNSPPVAPAATSMTSAAKGNEVTSTNTSYDCDVANEAKKAHAAATGKSTELARTSGGGDGEFIPSCWLLHSSEHCRPSELARAARPSVLDEVHQLAFLCQREIGGGGMSFMELARQHHHAIAAKVRKQRDEHWDPQDKDPKHAFRATNGIFCSEALEKKDRAAALSDFLVRWGDDAAFTQGGRR